MHMAAQPVRVQKPPKSIRERLDQIRQQDYLSVQDAALLLTCAAKTVRKYHRLIPLTMRVGRRIRVHRVSAVRFFLEQPTRRDV